MVDEGSVAAALELGRELRAGFYDALVAIGGGGLDQRDPDVLAVGACRIQRLVDALQPPLRREVDLHLLGAQRLVAVDGQGHARATG